MEILVRYAKEFRHVVDCAILRSSDAESKGMPDTAGWRHQRRPARAPQVVRWQPVREWNGGLQNR